MVDGGVGHQRSGEAARGCKDQSEETSHERGPRHPRPSRGPPNLVQSAEDDGRSDDAQEGHEQTPKEKLLADGACGSEREELTAVGAMHSGPKRLVQCARPRRSTDHDTRCCNRRYPQRYPHAQTEEPGRRAPRPEPAVALDGTSSERGGHAHGKRGDHGVDPDRRQKPACTLEGRRSVITSGPVLGSSTEQMPVPAGRHGERTFPCAWVPRKPGASDVGAPRGDRRLN
jgi:hypothetical protein